MDLNLLPVFRALLEAKNVSGAAKLVGLSQPAVSHALSRLRLHYKDPLFLRIGGRMEPTPRAQEIGSEITGALDRIAATLDKQFDPAKLNRTFKIALVSYSGFYMLPALIEKLRFEAPSVQILPEHSEEPAAYRALQNSDIDFAIGIFWDKTPSFRRSRLMSSRFVVIMRPNHPVKSKKITAAELASYPHVRVPILDNIDKILDAHGVTREFGATSPNPLAVPFMVARSDMFAILPSRLSMAFGSVCPLREAELSFNLPECDIELIVHPRHDADPAFHWFSNGLRTLAADIWQNIQPVTTDLPSRGSSAARGRKTGQGGSGKLSSVRSR